MYHLLICLTTILFTTCSLSDVSGKETPPNIVIILADDLGWADIGYNNPAVYSPNLDRLATEGMTFEQHYVMPQCTPTRVALMTGRYPSRFGGAALQASNEPAFPLGTPTIASLLQSAGYQTALIGKWHLGSHVSHGPNRFGFDYSYGSLAGAVGMYEHRYREGPFENTWHRNLEWIGTSEDGTHATDLVTDEAIRWIEQTDERPFLLYVPFHAVHTPLDERGNFIASPTQRDPNQTDRWLHEDEIPWFNDPDGKIQSNADPEQRLLLAAVHHLDSAIGKIANAIERAGKEKNTLILFSSDNGPQGSWPGNAYPDDLELTDFNQRLPFRGKKIDVYEGGIRVPGFAYWPSKITSSSVTTPTHIVDWLPTLLSISQQSLEMNEREPVDHSIDGVDLSPLLFDGQPIPDRPLYWNWNRTTNRWAVRLGDWKIVKYGKEVPTEPTDWSLFQLAEDPAESNDMAESFPEPLRQLHECFLSFRKEDAQEASR